MTDVTEILVHWYAGRSQSEVATSLGVDRKTIRKYLAPAEAAGIIPGGPPMSEADWANLLRSWFPELVPCCMLATGTIEATSETWIRRVRPRPKIPVHDRISPLRTLMRAS